MTNTTNKRMKWEIDMKHTMNNSYTHFIYD